MVEQVKGAKENNELRLEEIIRKKSNLESNRKNKQVVHPILLFFFFQILSSFVMKWTDPQILLVILHYSWLLLQIPNQPVVILPLACR